jgi:hypothetical protein
MFGLPNTQEKTKIRPQWNAILYLEIDKNWEITHSVY